MAEEKAAAQENAVKEAPKEPAARAHAKRKAIDRMTLAFIGLAIILIGIGLYFSGFSFEKLIEGYLYVLTHPAIADFDALAPSHVDHFGTAFFNSGLLLLCVTLIYRLTNTRISGVHTAAAMMVVGFSFYGKTILNVWWPIIGVFLYTIGKKRKLSSATALAFFSTALAPVFSVTVFGTAAIPSGTPQAYAAGMALGILAGLLVGVIADHLPNIHRGYVLFNAGFAAGFAGILINALRISLNIGHGAGERSSMYDLANETEYVFYLTGKNLPLGITMVIMFGYFILLGLIWGGGKNFVKMIGFSSKGGNYIQKFGYAASLINMGFMGLISVAYVIIVRGHLNGLLFACIFTACGFGANGNTARMYLPTMAGVFIAAFLTGGIGGVIAGKDFFAEAFIKFSGRGMLLAAIFSCGLAPIVGVHGTLAGLIVGFAHAILVPNTGAYHGWMSLYNNGLSLSLIAVFLHPLYMKMGIHADDHAANIWWHHK